ncbi:MAG: hypothetical protein BGO04_03690 [Microbacterium sp. 70-38]|nr:MAG: hypothetical protein BGO04_03690 [Microbacterium sp. 70-38]
MPWELDDRIPVEPAELEQLVEVGTRIIHEVAFECRCHITHLVAVRILDHQGSATVGADDAVDTNSRSGLLENFPHDGVEGLLSWFDGTTDQTPQL